MIFYRNADSGRVASFGNWTSGGFDPRRSDLTRPPCCGKRSSVVNKMATVVNLAWWTGIISDLHSEVKSSILLARTWKRTSDLLHKCVIGGSMKEEKRLESIALRKQGLSVKQIQKILGVARSFQGTKKNCWKKKRYRIWFILLSEVR